MPSLTTQAESLIATIRAEFESDCRKLLDAAKAAETAIEAGEKLPAQQAVIALNDAEYALTGESDTFDHLIAEWDVPDGMDADVKSDIDD